MTIYFICALIAFCILIGHFTHWFYVNDEEAENWLIGVIIGIGMASLVWPVILPALLARSIGKHIALKKKHNGE